MHDNDIRQICLRHRDKVQRFKLSTRQAAICRLVASRSDGVRSGEVADRLDCSLQSASTALANLHLRGYLRRDEVSQTSGGVEYVYHFADLRAHN